MSVQCGTEGRVSVIVTTKTKTRYRRERCVCAVITTKREKTNNDMSDNVLTRHVSCDMYPYASAIDPTNRQMNE